MDEINKEELMIKMIYSINDFKDEMLKSLNYIREDVKNLKGEINDLRTELKEEINDVRLELRNYKEENDKNWEKYEKNREEDKEFLINTLLKYDISISKQLGDPNTEKMRKIL